MRGAQSTGVPAWVWGERRGEAAGRIGPFSIHSLPRENHRLWRPGARDYTRSGVAERSTWSRIPAVRAG